MGARVRSSTVVALAMTLLAAPAIAHAEASPSDEVPARPRLFPYRAVDLQAVTVARSIPKPFFGLDAMLSLGNDTFQLRAGGQIAGAPAFRVGSSSVTNIMEVAQLDGCVGKAVERHRIRACLGGQAGVWQHEWHGGNGRRWSPWVAGTMKGDYRLAFTPRFGLIFGVGVVVPVVGPSFGTTAGDSRHLVIPSPVSGFVSLGASFRFI